MDFSKSDFTKPLKLCSESGKIKSALIFCTSNTFVDFINLVGFKCINLT